MVGGGWGMAGQVRLEAGQEAASSRGGCGDQQVLRPHASLLSSSSRVPRPPPLHPPPCSSCPPSSHPTPTGGLSGPLAPPQPPSAQACSRSPHSSFAYSAEPPTWQVSGAGGPPPPAPHPPTLLLSLKKLVGLPALPTKQSAPPPKQNRTSHPCCLTHGMLPPLWTAPLQARRPPPPRHARQQEHAGRTLTAPDPHRPPNTHIPAHKLARAGTHTLLLSTSLRACAAMPVASTAYTLRAPALAAKRARMPLPVPTSSTTCSRGRQQQQRAPPGVSAGCVGVARPRRRHRGGRRTSTNTSDRQPFIRLAKKGVPAAPKMPPAAPPLSRKPSPKRPPAPPPKQAPHAPRHVPSCAFHPDLAARPHAQARTHAHTFACLHAHAAKRNRTVPNPTPAGLPSPARPPLRPAPLVAPSHLALVTLRTPSAHVAPSPCPGTGAC